MSFGGGSSPTPATTTTSFATDPLSQSMAAGLRSSIAPSAQTNAAINALGQSGDARGLADPSIDLLRRTVSGEFTNPEYLSSQIEAAANPAIRNFRRAIAPSLSANFAASGRSGSGAEMSAMQDAQDTLGRNIAEISSGMISGERDRQQAASGVFTDIAANDRAQSQAEIDASRERFNRMSQVAGLLPNFRTTQSTGATQGSSGKGGALGSLAGGVAGSFLGPVGTAAGSSLGNALFSGGSA